MESTSLSQPPGKAPVVLGFLQELNIPERTVYEKYQHYINVKGGGLQTLCIVTTSVATSK